MLGSQNLYFAVQCQMIMAISEIEKGNNVMNNMMIKILYVSEFKDMFSVCMI